MSNSTYLEDNEPRNWWQEQYENLRKEYESLQKIHGWVARDKNGELNLFPGEPYRAEGRYLRCWYNDGGFCRIDSKLFPEITWESEPVEVELLIRKIESTKQV